MQEARKITGQGNDAFSLVELSIVLVILGLLTGGILSGQSLIRAAELRAVTTTFQAYQSALHGFQDKYSAIPGDMNNAERFWGTDPDGCPTHSVRVKKKETCNGNGDGRLTDAEGFRFWQQLANAGLIEGSYTGVSGDTGTHAIVGDNVPVTRISQVGFTVWFLGDSGGNANAFRLNYGNVFEVGKERSPGRTINAFLMSEEAWNIDQKIDDGKPGFGRLIVYNWDVCTHAADRNDVSTEYDPSTRSISCSFYFRDVF